MGILLIDNSGKKNNFKKTIDIAIFCIFNAFNKRKNAGNLPRTKKKWIDFLNIDVTEELKKKIAKKGDV